jgi:hypothetical protein
MRALLGLCHLLECQVAHNLSPHPQSQQLNCYDSPMREFLLLLALIHVYWYVCQRVLGLE